MSIIKNKKALAEYVIFSNDKNCLRIDTSERRYLVTDVKNTTKEIEEKKKLDEIKEGSK